MIGNSFSRYSHEKSWTVLTESGQDAVNFTSFIDIEFSNESLAPDYPIEQGGFANYNKVQTPARINLTLALQGTDAEIERALDKLDRFSGAAEKLIVATPSTIYDSLTLTSVSYSRRAGSGASLLTVQLSFVEVREVRTQVTTSVITRPKNPTSASKVEEGRVPTSVLQDTKEAFMPPAA